MQVHKPQVVALLEPRVSGDVGLAIRQKLRFNISFVVEAQGFSGGIWLLWNESDFTIRVLTSSNQFIHTMIEWDSGKSVAATFIYASRCSRTTHALERHSHALGFGSSALKSDIRAPKFTWFRRTLKEHLD
ncbi:hypothetical protein LINPERHAP2_LOCUS39584 [Linum perenne]